jgi:hypothetical protein
VAASSNRRRPIFDVTRAPLAMSPSRRFNSSIAAVFFPLPELSL